MEKKRTNNTKFKTFLKKNIYYIIMALCILAIATMITVTVILNNQNVDNTPPAGNIDPTDPTDPTDPVGPTDPTDPVGPTDPTDPDPTPIVFTSPVSSVNILRDYVITDLVWHTTLKHFAVHEAINFGGTDGTSVMSAYGGTVESVEYDRLNGYVVTIKHNNELKTSYGSLNEPTVVVGQTIAKGEVIGTMGATATIDYLDGAHVTFRLYKNGELSDPYEYLSIGDK